MDLGPGEAVLRSPLQVLLPRFVSRRCGVTMGDLQESHPKAPAARSARWIGAAASAVVLLLLTLVLQWASGAYSCEFGGHPDEPAHFVTGLLVRDYVAAGAPPNPMRFAENYYLHYPKVAFGHWPPAFYIVQALWTLVFPVSRLSLMLLMAVLITVSGLLLQQAVAQEHGAVAGLVAACFLVSIPEVQLSADRVMAEAPVALFSLAALIWFARYLRTERWRDAAGFAAFSAAAILTKGVALALAAVPLVSVMATRRFSLLRKASFWMPAVAVAVICAPAYLLLPVSGVAYYSKAHGVVVSLGSVFSLAPYLSRQMGLVAALLCGVGLFLWLWDAIHGSAAPGMPGVSGALVVGYVVIRVVVVAARDDRHVVMIAGPLIILAASGAAWAARRLRLFRWATPAGLLLAAVAVFLATAWRVPHKPYFGLDVVAADLLAASSSSPEVLLISSDSAGEGVFVSEVAMRESRPGRYVLRASKVLSRSYWSGRHYELLLRTSGAVAKYLDSVPVAAVVLSFRPGAVSMAHHALLHDALRANPEVWQEREYRNSSGDRLGDRILVYHRRVPLSSPRPHIRVDLQYELGRTLEN